MISTFTIEAMKIACCLKMDEASGIPREWIRKYLPYRIENKPDQIELTLHIDKEPPTCCVSPPALYPPSQRAAVPSSQENLLGLNNGILKFKIGFLKADYDTSNREGVVETTLADFTHINRFLIMLYSYEIIRQGGIIVHASAVTGNDGMAHVFFGSPGCGKTTLSINLPGYSVLADEMVGLRKIGDVYYAFPLPFDTKTGENSCVINGYPVAGIYQLVKGRITTLLSVKKRDSLISLWAQTFHYLKVQEETERILAIFQDLLLRIPTIGFQFQPEEIYGRGASICNIERRWQACLVEASAKADLSCRSS